MPAALNPFIEHHVCGLTFADIGGLWGTVNEKVSVASNAGAKSATLIDITPQGHEMWAVVREHCASMGVSGYREVTGNLDDVSLPERVGTFEFVHCSGIIYHCPNPIETLNRLHALTQKYLLLGSMTVPRDVVGKAGALRLDTGSCLFLPAVSGIQKEIVADHFADRGVRVHNIDPTLTAPWYLDGAPSYEPWWWLWTPETLAAMVAASNFRVIDVVEAWSPELAHAVFAEKM